MKKVGMNMERVKHQNRALIMNCISDSGPISRTDIAKKTGFTAASVTQITNLLIEEGLLVETGSVPSDSGTAGRRKILLDINRDAAYIYCINIEPEETTLAVCDLKGDVLKDESENKLIVTVPTDKSIAPEAFLKKCAELSLHMAERKGKRHQGHMKCVSVCVTGVVDGETAVSKKAYGIWDEEVNLGEPLKKVLNVPVVAENNVDAFAEAEILFGVGREKDNLLIIKWGPGVGSTIITDGKIYKGRHGRAAELGHYIIDKEGKQCSCGRRGCLETFVSYSAIREILPIFDSDKIENIRDFLSEKAAEKFKEIIDTFAICITNTATILAPNRIVLCGPLFRNKKIRDRLIEACSSLSLYLGEKRIIYTELSEKENYIGPVAVFFQRALLGESSNLL